MVKNMGNLDRAIRVGIAIVIAVLIVTGVLQGALAVVLGVLAAIFVLTSLVGSCPLYMPFRINTRGR